MTGYRVERCQGAGCTKFAQVATPTGTSFSDTGLTARRRYRYRVRAVDAAGNLGAYSASSGRRPRPSPDTTPPSVPARVAADGGEFEPGELSWTASTDNVGVTGYRVERCQGAGCTTFTQVGTPIGGDVSAIPGFGESTTYRYRVLAVDASGNLSGYSAVVDVTTPAAPPVPAGLVGGVFV